MFNDLAKAMKALDGKKKLGTELGPAFLNLKQLRLGQSASARAATPCATAADPRL